MKNLKKHLIIIPTFNERNNIKFILKKISKNIKFKHDILFIDDNSNDGTQEIIKKIKSKNILLIIRKKKLGIGSAHKFGIKYAYKNNYHYIITMDCDGTHDPVYINSMLKLLKTNDLILTNRFKGKKSLAEWSLYRKLITTLRHFVVRSIFNTDLDSSGAFRCYNIKKIRINDILSAKNNSYSFFTESTIILSKKYKISQIPILLPKRYAGSSKMKFLDILLGFLYIIMISFRKNI